jgi:hypothetical protein
MENLLDFAICTSIGAEEEIIEIIHGQRNRKKQKLIQRIGILIIEMSMIEADSEKKSRNSHDKPESSKSEIVEKLIGRKL